MENIDKKVIGVLVTKISIVMIILAVIAIISSLEGVADAALTSKKAAFVGIVVVVALSLVVYGLAKARGVKDYLKNVKDEDVAFDDDDDDDF